MYAKRPVEETLEYIVLLLKFQNNPVAAFPHAWNKSKNKTEENMIKKPIKLDWKRKRMKRLSQH